MARWTPDARSRLAQVALELYLEQGFEQTTVAEIAARAGLTERTFFRHFADKREVLFGGSAALEEAMTGAMAQVDQGRPMDLILAAVDSAGPFFGDDPSWARRRQQIVMNNPSLLERELIKLHGLGTTLAAALEQRGVAPAAATLSARLGTVVFWETFVRWAESPPPVDWSVTARQVWQEVQAVAGA